MLPEIGIMVGFYIIVRILNMERTKDGRPTAVTRIFALVTLVVTGLVILDLGMRGFSYDTIPGL